MSDEKLTSIFSIGDAMDTVIKYFDRHAESYAARVTAEERRARQQGLKRLAPTAGEHILEIGSGVGEDLVKISQLGATVTGVDGAAAMVEAAKLRVASEGAEATVLHAAVPPLPDLRVDAVWSSFTLELLSLAEIGRILSEVHQLLEPNGRLGLVSLALTWPDLAGIDCGATSWQDCFLRADHDPLNWKSLLADAGFEVTHSEQATLQNESVDIITAVRAGPASQFDMADLINGLTSRDTMERIRSRQRICLLGSAAIPSITELVKSGTDQARAAAAKCMHWIGDGSTGDLFASLLDDPSDKVRWIAVEGLIKLGDTQAVADRLTESTGDSHRLYESAGRVIRTLHRRGDSRLKPLVDAFEDDQPEVSVPVVAMRLRT